MKFQLFNLLNKVGIVSVGEFFGDIEIFEDKPRMNTIVCESNEGVLYRLNKRDFLKFMAKDEQTLDIFKADRNRKSQWRSNLIKAAQKQSMNITKNTSETSITQRKSSNSMNNDERKSSTQRESHKRSKAFLSLLSNEKLDSRTSGRFSKLSAFGGGLSVQFPNYIHSTKHKRTLKTGSILPNSMEEFHTETNIKTLDNESTEKLSMNN